MNLPTLITPRLIVGPFHLDDAPTVQKLAGEEAIARKTGKIPHPYPDGVAEKWIAGLLLAFLERQNATLAIREKDGTLVGACGLTLNMEHRRAELGYWVGVPWWGRGYATEAAQSVVKFGFDCLDLEKIHAHHMSGNPASGRVMEKIGMTCEGCLRRHIWKNGQVHDFVIHSILRDEFPAVSPLPAGENPAPSSAP